jgi:hypothetical protein
MRSNVRFRTNEGTVVVRVPSRPFRKRLTETYGELLQAVLVEVGMPDVQLNFVCNEPEGCQQVPNQIPNSTEFARPDRRSKMSSS